MKFNRKSTWAVFFIKPYFTLSVLAILALTIFYTLLFIIESDGSNHRFTSAIVHHTVDIWTNSSVLEHRFLSFEPDSVDPYLSRPLFSTLGYVGYQWIFESIFAITDYWSTYLLYIFYSAFSVLVVFLLYFRTSHYFAYVLFFSGSLGIFLCSGSAFHYYYHFPHGNFFSIVALSIAMISAFHVEKDLSIKPALYLVFLIPLVIWGNYAHLVFLVFFILFEHPNISKKWFVSAFFLLSFSVVYPYLAGDPSLPGSGSGVLMRSGLNGVTDRLSDHIQAFFDPSHQGTSSPLRRWLPILTAILAILLLSILKIDAQLKEDLKKFFKTLMIGLIGYLPDLIIFPQAVSVHPYLYDFFWLMPLYVSVVFFAAKRACLINYRIMTYKEFYLLAGFGLIVMMNLLHIAQLG